MQNPQNTPPICHHRHPLAHIHTHFHTHHSCCSHGPIFHQHPFPHFHLPHLHLFHPHPYHHHHHHHHHHHLQLSPLPPQVSNGEQQVAGPSTIGHLQISDEPCMQTCNENSKQPMLEHEDLRDDLELEEEECEDVFVMTDEWKEFFAKSEAKRRLKKEQRKKGSR